MSQYNSLYKEQVSILAYTAPASVAASTVVTAWVDFANFHRICARIHTGVLGASATLDAKLQQATDSSGTGAKDITGKAIVQIVKASGDNKIAMIETGSSALDVANGFEFVAVSFTVGVAASIVGVTIEGINGRFHPASDYNIAAVVQQIP
jgi:hypothetical protein